MPDKTSTCFIAMPITVHADEAALYGDSDHWRHVIEMLFIPAVKSAGFEAILPSAEGTSMIHGRIIRHLVESDLVLCDLSQHNPNVLFELGVRTSINKPVALVKDNHLGLPFDIQGLNTHHYDSGLAAWDLTGEIDKLATHIRVTARDSAGANPLWRHFGVDAIATAPSVDATTEDARLEILMEKIDALSRDVAGERRTPPTTLEGKRARSLEDRVALGIGGVADVQSFSTVDGTTHMYVSTKVSNPDEQIERATDLMHRLIKQGFAVVIEDTGPSSIDLRVKPA